MADAAHAGSREAQAPPMAVPPGGALPPPHPLLAGSDLASTREQLAGVLAELCSTLGRCIDRHLYSPYTTTGGYTVVLKSEGEIGNIQADILGVYRMADSHCDRPVYKQDGGENYIYYR